MLDSKPDRYTPVVHAFMRGLTLRHKFKPAAKGSICRGAEPLDRLSLWHGNRLVSRSPYWESISQTARKPRSHLDTSAPQSRIRTTPGTQQKIESTYIAPEQFPDWLPRDWRLEVRTRGTGNGQDKYYWPPGHGSKLRSKREVEEYLQRN